METSTLCPVDVNTLSIQDSSDLTPQPRFKRKQEIDDYTPKSRHIDKRIPIANTPVAKPPRSPESVFHVEEAAFDASTSVGSAMSHPDFSASVSVPLSNVTDAPEPDVAYLDVKQIENGPEPSCSTLESRQTSPVHTPRAQDYQNFKTPKSAMNGTLRRITTTGITTTRQPSKTPTAIRFTEADLMSFQTPAPRRPEDGQTQLQRFKDDEGRELLLDVTPRVYSPRSIPIYTLQDLDEIKSQFEQARRELENKIESLHIELAASISHANHHKALAAQGDSLHSEYSKKHVRKVTALKTEWEKKTTDKLVAKDEMIAERDATIVNLRAALEQEREEKREVIVMAEAVLALQGQQSEAS